MRETQKLTATAVAERFRLFKRRRISRTAGRADFNAFDKIMRRRGGNPPRDGDEMPPRKRRLSPAQ